MGGLGARRLFPAERRFLSWFAMPSWQQGLAGYWRQWPGWLSAASLCPESLPRRHFDQISSALLVPFLCDECPTQRKQ